MHQYRQTRLRANNSSFFLKTPDQGSATPVRGKSLTCRQLTFLFLGVSDPDWHNSPRS